MPSPQIVVLAAIAFGRIAGGIRSVQIEWIDGLHMPFAIPLTRSAANEHGRADVERQHPERRGLERHGERDQAQSVHPLGEERGTRGCSR